MFEDAERQLKAVIQEAENLVFFGGAGVSTESGIPDFRGAGGLYTREDGESVPPETVISIGYFMRHPREFYAYYRTHMLYPDARPNPAHIALARWEREGKLRAVVTQNIDGLHQRAGSRRVIELHGSSLRNHCLRCGKKYPVDHILQADGLPLCACGGLVRPDVVLYGEPLDGDAIDAAVEAIRAADVLMVGGTSLTVQPAASLVRTFTGKHLIIINRTPTPYDEMAEILIHAPIAKTLGGLLD